jgi:predicted dinucleotide-binding enzyme
MKIAVIGAGRIGGTIGGAWESAGHDVVYGLRDHAKKSGARTIADALKGAEVVLLAVPGNAVVQLVKDHAKDIDGRIVIDATNHFGAAKFQHWPEVSAVAPHAHLYRAFNTYGFDVFAKPDLGGTTADLFYCGPEAGKDTVEKLIGDVGMNPVWVGGQDAVDVVDGVLRLWVALSQRHGRRIALKLITD